MLLVNASHSFLSLFVVAPIQPFVLSTVSFAFTSRIIVSGFSQSHFSCLNIHLTFREPRKVKTKQKKGQYERDLREELEILGVGTGVVRLKGEKTIEYIDKACIILEGREGLEESGGGELA